MAARMMDAISLIPEFGIVAIASSSGNNGRSVGLAKVFNVSASYDHIGPLLARRDVDLVYVANETSGHARVSIAALQSGKNVLCEKPLASSYDEACVLAERAADSGRLLMEAMWTPFLPSYRRFDELLRKGRIGSPMQLTASFGYPSSPEASRSEFDVERGGGVLLDRAVYPICLSVKALGPVTSIETSSITYHDRVDVHSCLQMIHESKAYSQISTSLISLLSNSAVVSGAAGSLTLEPPLVGCEDVTVRKAVIPGANPAEREPTVTQRLTDRLRSVPSVRLLRRRILDGRKEFCSYGPNQYLPLLKHVLALLRAGRQESNVVPLRVSMEVLRVVDLAKRAASGPPSTRPPA
jgi:predicted dehydrogenase